MNDKYWARSFYYETRLVIKSKLIFEWYISNLKCIISVVEGVQTSYLITPSISFKMVIFHFLFVPVKMTNFQI